MIKLFQSMWFANGLGLVLYLATTVLTWRPGTGADGTHKAKDAESATPSWVFHNPEVTHLIDELRRERAALAEKEKILAALSARLEVERQELNQLTQNVQSLRMEFDQNVIRVHDQEVSNLKKLGKIYAGMAAENAAPILRQMDETALVKILGSMKESESGPILEVMGRGGEAESKLAATVSERLRLLLPAAANSKPSNR
jgi:flagellar motility protein MotE (MotC chaperone)